MRGRTLLFAGLSLALLAACDAPGGNILGGRALPPDLTVPGAPGSVPAAVEPVPTPDSSNREMAAFLADNLIYLRKYPRALRIATVVGAREMDLRTWPGTVVADEVQVQATKCGTPVQFVGIDQDFDLLVGFAHTGRNSAQDQKDQLHWATMIERNRRRAAQSLADVLNVELEVQIDTDVGNAKGEYPYDRWHQFLNYKVPDGAELKLLPRMPVETWRENYDKVIAEIGPAAPDTSAKQGRTEEFRTSYLDGVMAICANNFFADLLNRGEVQEPPQTVTTLLRDDRVREGMSRDEFAAAALIVLNEVRPGK